MTRPTRHRVLYQSKTSAIVTSWSCHHCAIPRHMMMSNALQLLLDRSFLVSRYLSGKCHALFIMWSFSIMLYHLFSHHMSYAPILTHPWTNFFPMTTFFLCLCWFICSHDPLHFLTILPIVLTLLLAFVLYCCSIYGSHICGVLSRPQFLYLSCIR